MQSKACMKNATWMVKIHRQNESTYKTAMCIGRAKHLLPKHHKRSEIWVASEGEFVQDDEVFYVKKGDELNIPVGGKQ